MSANGSHGGGRWVRHPVGARILGSATIVAPAVAAVGCAVAVSILVPQPPGLRLLWWTAVIGTGIAAFMGVRRFERHGLALAALLEMAIVFPVRPPSRLDVVLTAARRPRLEALDGNATSGNGFGTKQAAVALAGALRAFDKRTRRETPILQRAGVGVVALSIATIIASLTLGGPVAVGRASRLRHSLLGGAAHGPTPAAIPSGPPASAAPFPDTVGLAPPVPTTPVGGPTAVATIEPALHPSSAAASPASAALPAAEAAVAGGSLGGGGGAPIFTTATATAPVGAGNSGANSNGAPPSTSATFGAAPSNRGTLRALAARGPRSASNDGTPSGQAASNPSSPATGGVSAPSGDPGNRDQAVARTVGGGQPDSRGGPSSP